MAGVSVDISQIGDKGLVRALARLRGPTQKRVVRKAQVRAMRPILKATRALVPVDTGLLRKNIKAKSASSRKKGLVRVLSLPLRGVLGIEDSDKFFFPAVLEYGGKHSKAFAFLRGGFDSQESNALAIMIREIRRWISVEWNKR